MSIGRLRHRLVLERALDTADGSGGTSVVWQTIASIWGAIEPTHGMERAISDQLQAQVTHDITIRYRADVTSRDRFRNDSRIFEILSVVNAHESSVWLKCRCRETIGL